MNGQNRIDIKIGAAVKIVLKSDQRTGKLTEGIVGKILTNSSFHPHGIKVMLTNGQVGRVQEILWFRVHYDYLKSILIRGKYPDQAFSYFEMTRVFYG